MAVMDFEGRFLSVNGEWSGLWGMRRALWQGKDMSTYVHPADRRGTVSLLLSGSTGGERRAHPIRLLSTRNSYRTLELISVRIGGSILVFGKRYHRESPESAGI